MTEKKPIYTTFSWIRFAKDLVFGLIIIYFITSVFFGSENEININALAIGIFLIIFIIIIDSKELEVYENKLRIKSNHLFGLISRKTDIELSNIKDITYSGKFSQSNDLTQDFLRLILPVFDFIGLFRFIQFALYHLNNPLDLFTVPEYSPPLFLYSLTIQLDLYILDGAKNFLLAPFTS